MEFEETRPGHGVWRSTCGRYVITRVALPETPHRDVFQARRVDQHTARAYPTRGDMGTLLAESPWCWNLDNSVHSAEAECGRDAWMLDNPAALNVPDDTPAVALHTFHFSPTGRGALAVTRRDGRLYAQILAAHRVTEDTTRVAPLVEIDLTALGFAADPDTLPTITTHGEQCIGCNVKPGQPHDDGCDWATCLVTGGQRALCATFGGSLTAGMEALATGNTDEFDLYFKTPTGHNCGRDIFRGNPSGGFSPNRDPHQEP